MKSRKRCSISFDRDHIYTEQQHKDACNINVIMKKYSNTGMLPQITQRQAQFINALDSHDFMEAQFILAEARSMFEDVPSDIRLQFDNDPNKYMLFMSNPENREAIEKMGVDASYFGEEKVSVNDLIRQTVNEINNSDQIDFVDEQSAEVKKD
ncbi:internal scaffolding protein [Microviridae sp.]|nr:internal scaffolding protein [Microviridae sp.]